MTAIAKSAKTHPAAKKCWGWEELAICISFFFCQNMLNKHDFKHTVNISSKMGVASLKQVFMSLNVVNKNLSGTLLDYSCCCCNCCCFCHRL